MSDRSDIVVACGRCYEAINISRQSHNLVARASTCVVYHSLL